VEGKPYQPFVNAVSTGDRADAYCGGRTETRVTRHAGTGPDRDGESESERVIDMRGILTKRLHIDLARVASAFCCR
jgi:hypothetical protein